MKPKAKNLLSLLLICIIAVVMLPMTALAVEDVTVPEGWYKVTVKVAPAEATVKFYSDSDARTEITENVYDDGVVDGYHQYTFVAPEGTYSYRAWEGEQYLGGMEFNVPIADEYNSDGELMGKGQVLTLKRVNFLTTSTHITKTEDYTLHLIPQDLKEAVNGTNYVNENGNVVCPVMINAGGNALTYNMVVDVNGELGKSYAVAPQQHLTFGPGTSAITSEFAVDSVTWYTITVPAQAKAQMFLQKNNYNVTEIPEDESKKEIFEDGTVRHHFATPGGTSLTYRVSMNNKVTKAGFADRANRDMTFTFAASENPKSTRTTAARIENSSMLNVNTQNYLRLAVGETFRLRSFRAGWEIINTDTANIMIEPDFHYNIISGGEHIELVPVTDKCTGNAGSGMNANWMDIKAVSSGVVVLEVSFDAIDISGDTNYPGIFGACGEDGKSVVVIEVGAKEENTLTITPIGGSKGEYDWDSDFDRVYFEGDTGEFTFKAVMGGGAPDKVELSTDLGKTWKTVEGGEGTYIAEGLIHGNNILKVTKDSKVEYQVVRGSKVTVTIVNMTRTGDTIIAGDQVRVIFSNIYSPIPKMSGIYNPGFGTEHQTLYNVPEGVTASSTSTQYGFAADNQYNLTLSEAGTYTFTGGQILSQVMGDPQGGHRLLTDTGRGVNFNATGYTTYRSVLPNFTIEVIDMPTVQVTVESDPKGASLELKDESGTVLEPNKDGTYSLEYGTYSYTMLKDGYVPERGKFIVGGDDNETGEKLVTITMRAVGGVIWDGKTVTEPEKDKNGVYLIGTGPELAWYAANHNGASAKLTADVSLGGYSVQISGLKGTFDGNGHYVTDYYGTKSLFQFPASGSKIKNLGVEGIIRDSTEYEGQGGIATGSGNYTVESCVSRVDVSGSGRGMAGIVGYASSTSSVSMPRIINCYNTGDVVGIQYGYTGGVAGLRDSTDFNYVENCYNTGNISGSKPYSITYPGRGTKRNNYALLGTAPNMGGTGVTGEVLKTYAEYLGDAYMYNPTSYNEGYPILKWEEPRALEVAKVEFAAELEAYENGEGFAEGAKAQLVLAVKDGKKAISKAETLEEAYAALEQSKKAIDTIDPEDLVLAGDTNDDGEINGKDAILMARYLAGDKPNSFNTANADFNGDGEINGKDAILLAQYLAN